MARTVGKRSGSGKKAAGRRSSDRPSSAGGTAKGRGDARPSQAQGRKNIAPPAWFIRSSVYRKIPDACRAHVDAALLLRPPGCKTLAAIARKFKLSVRYGVSVDALRRYAQQMERLVRPVVASQVMAGVLGCLPAEFRRRLAHGSEVLLLSKVNQALGDENTAALSVAELAKLADVLKALAQRRAGADNASGGAKTAPGGAKTAPGGAPETTRGMDPSKLAEAVRTLYGLSWPPAATKPSDGDE